jgi:DNA-binding CsgD family transcriptional regulator
MADVSTDDSAGAGGERVRRVGRDEPPRADVSTDAGLPGQVDPIVGRAPELEALNTFVDSLERGPAMSVLEGEPGLGKTTLWREGLRAAERRSFQVLECRPVQAEAQLAFTALSDLLTDVPEVVLDELPVPQRRAIEVALLRAEPEDEEHFPRAVALGFLGVLVALARSGPLVVGIDDVHWLDQASQRVLAFAVRRVREERIGLLLAHRTGTDSVFPGDAEHVGRMAVTRLRLSTLDADELERLLRRHLGGQLDRRSIARLHHSSGGNPLFALQLGRAMLQGDVVDEDGLGLLIPATLQRVVADQLLALTPAALDVVQAAAAVARPTTALIESVVATDRAREGLAAAGVAGVLSVDRGRVGFTHPLLATAAYSQMSAFDRRRLHARLAEVVDDVEERGRHLAAAAERPGTEVATALDAAALRARARYAPDTAAELWEAAARFTPADQGPMVWERRRQAADCLFEAGEVVRARVVLENIASSASPGPTRSRSMVRLAWVVAHIEGFEAGAVAFERALDELGDDVTAEVEVEEGLAWCLHSSSGLAAAEPHARRALSLAEASGDPQLIAGALTNLDFLGSLAGRGLAVEAVGQVAHTADAPGREILVRPDWMHGLLLEFDDRLVEARERFATLRRDAADRGDEQSLPFILFHLARTQLLSGQWTQALRTARECSEAARSSGQASEHPYSCFDIEALVEAHLGVVDAALTRIAEGLELTDRFGVIPARLEMMATRGFLELSLGRNDEADRTLTEVAVAAENSGLLEPGLFRYHGDAIEAKIALGRLDEAATLADGVERLAATLQRPWLALIAGRGRGLLLAARGQLDDACDVLSAALAEDRTGQPFERARTLLAFGSVQRRHRQKAGARDALVAAQNEFTDLGATLWVHKAAAELARVGGRAPAAGLTPTERQVAELIAAGRTYREVAAELFISPKTVQWNLSKVYRKLDIRSRAELPGRLEPS